MSKREILLPGYLAQNELWVRLVQALDDVWANGSDSRPGIDAAIAELRRIRRLYAINNSGAAKVADANMLLPEDFYLPERQTQSSKPTCSGCLSLPPLC
jgi:hypothetical protein